MAFNAAVVVGAHVARAEQLAALGLITLAVVTLHLGRVRDRSVAAVTSEAVAVQILHRARNIRRAWLVQMALVVSGSCASPFTRDLDSPDVNDYCFVLVPLSRVFVS